MRPRRNSRLCGLFFAKRIDISPMIGYNTGRGKFVRIFLEKTETI